MTIEIEALQLKLGYQVGCVEDGFETVVAKSWCLVDGIGELIICRLRTIEEDEDTMSAMDFIWCSEPKDLVTVKRDGGTAHMDPNLEQLMELDKAPLRFRSYSEV